MHCAVLNKLKENDDFLTDIIYNFDIAYQDIYSI